VPIHFVLQDVHFNSAFYKSLLGQPVGLSDLTEVDPQLHDSLAWMLENPVEGLELYFNATHGHFGEECMIDLKEGGSDIPVTDDNKAEFVEIRAHWTLVGMVRYGSRSLVAWCSFTLL
jgi:hypothetical protein